MASHQVLLNDSKGSNCVMFIEFESDKPEYSDPEVFLETLGRLAYYWLKNTDSGQEYVSAMLEYGKFEFCLYDFYGITYIPELPLSIHYYPEGSSRKNFGR